MIPFILSGGSGTRLWPVSRAHFPKQFCSLFSESLQTMTYRRLSKLETPWIVTSDKVKVLTESELKALGQSTEQVIYEPEARNTAPAMGLMLKTMLDLGRENEVIGVFPSDHLILKNEEFYQALRFAEELALNNQVVTLGIQPTYPETGYGYIQTQPNAHVQAGEYSAFSVLKFHEKPAIEKAESFVKQGHFFWNAGIFVFKVSTMIQHFKTLAPEIWNSLANIKYPFVDLKEVYKNIQSISVDYAIMEKLLSEQLTCIPVNFGWSDVGSWDAVAATQEQSTNYSDLKNAIEVNSHGNYVHGFRNKKYSFVGMEDTIVVDTADATLIVKKGSGQDVKKVTDLLADSDLVKNHVFEQRPWGDFEILRDENHFKSKVIKVLPGAQISYQSHAKREEHWIMTRGQGEVVLNDSVIPVVAGSHVHIPLQAKHRIRNTGKVILEFVEVQLGSYFGEDDIVRYQDDYKRV